MVTTTEIADAIDVSRVSLETMFSNSGWDKSLPMSMIFGGQHPPISAGYIIRFMEGLAAEIRGLSTDRLNEPVVKAVLSGALPLIQAIPWPNFQNTGGLTVVHAMSLLNSLAAGVISPQPAAPEIDWEDLKEQKTLLPKDLARRLRSVEAKLTDLEPRRERLDDMIADIEAAHSAAEQLPTDLAELTEKRSDLERIAKKSKQIADGIHDDSIIAGESRKKTQLLLEKAENAVEDYETKASALIARSEQALRGATSVGLSAAFKARKDSLTKAGVIWTVCLVAALGAGLWIGSTRIVELNSVISQNKSPTVIWVNAILTLMGVGGPIWFAWLSTKQIGASFRLSEDYAFKSSVSQAYEGYRAEAISLDPSFQARLFANALTRLEEAPIRLVDSKQHSSPLQELLDNPVFRTSLEKVPDAASKLTEMVAGKGAAIVAPVAAAAAAIGSVVGSAKSRDENKEDNTDE